MQNSPNFVIAIPFRVFLRFSERPRENEISDVCIDKEAILLLPATVGSKNEFTVAPSLKWPGHGTGSQKSGFDSCGRKDFEFTLL